MPRGIVVIDGRAVGGGARLWLVATWVGQEDGWRNALFKFFDVQYYFGFHTSLVSCLFTGKLVVADEPADDPLAHLSNRR